jgi:hypothetical protein
MGWLKNTIIRKLVRFRLSRMTKEGASQLICDVRDEYLTLAAELGELLGSREVVVKPMVGVDEEMRGWSYFQLIEHNAIVNRSMTSLMVSLAEGRAPDGGEVKNPKTDVLPSPGSGVEQLAAFQDSITAHLEAVAPLANLRETAVSPHPLFGDFTAFHWHAMFAFHLKVHLPQARAIAAGAKAGASGR